MINAAMIGLGRWGQSILGAVQGKSDRVRFVHGVSKEPELASDIVARHGLRLSTDLADALADPEVQAVWLATPHSLHVQQVQAVTATGRPVWCEKPLALTRAKAQRAVDAWPQGGRAARQRQQQALLCLDARAARACRQRQRSATSCISRGIFPTSTRRASVGGGWRDDPNESPAAGLTGGGPARARCFRQSRRRRSAGRRAACSRASRRRIRATCWPCWSSSPPAPPA